MHHAGAGGAGLVPAGAEVRRRPCDNEKEGAHGGTMGSSMLGQGGGAMTETTVAAPVIAPGKVWVGESIPRKEDRRLVQGQGVFFDDLRRHGMGYVHFVRSPYGHAAITSIDVSAAAALEGVYGTLIGEEVA